MIVQTVAIAFFGLAALLFAAGVFHTVSMVRSALSLLATMTCIGCMFLAMQAEFLGVLQIMMMATEMSIMAIFMVMFMMDPGGLMAMDMKHQKWLSLAAGLVSVVAVLLLIAFTGWGPVSQTFPAPAEQNRQLGQELLQRSMLIFEAAGVSILAAMVAATVVAIKGRQP